jgi:hypothetical protein
MAEDGEYIINKKAAKKYHSVIDDINNDRVRGFQLGGPVYAQGGAKYHSVLG